LYKGLKGIQSAIHGTGGNGDGIRRYGKAVAFPAQGRVFRKDDVRFVFNQHRIDSIIAENPFRLPGKRIFFREPDAVFQGKAAFSGLGAQGGGPGNHMGRFENRSGRGAPANRKQADNRGRKNTLGNHSVRKYAVFSGKIPFRGYFCKCRENRHMKIAVVPPGRL
jgi:hypothetical protein